jgi:predicted kinase
MSLHTLHITRGLPASGKTTLAREWLAEDPTNRARVNRDDLRAMMFAAPTYDFAQEVAVTAASRSLVKDLLKNRDVITDDTNLRPSYVREWRKFAAMNGVDLVVHECYVTVNDAVSRDQARGDSGGRRVGEDVIRGMAGKFTKRSATDPCGYHFLPIIDEPVEVEAAAYTPRLGSKPAIIVDIDGTVALMGDRSPYDLSRVHEDRPNHPVIAAVRAAWHDGLSVVYCSGRDDSSREVTEKWLATHVGVPGPLLMRAADDRRKDSIVKRELFDAHIRDEYDVRYVLDDRQQVVDMWRSLGLTCLQVAKGDF